MGDKGYIGNDMLTPFEKPVGGGLLKWQKECNKQINKIRWVIGQVISHFKTWAILRTDRRRPLKTFPETISVAIGLQFYKMARITFIVTKAMRGAVRSGSATGNSPED